MKKAMGVGMLMLSGLVLSGCGPQLTQDYLVENDWVFDAEELNEASGEDVPVTIFADFDETVMTISFELQSDASMSAEDQMAAGLVAPMLEGLSFDMNYTLDGDQLILEQEGEFTTHIVSLDDEGNILSDVVEPEGQEPLEDESLLLRLVEPTDEAAESAE